MYRDVLLIGRAETGTLNFFGSSSIHGVRECPRFGSELLMQSRVRRFKIELAMKRLRILAQLEPRPRNA